VKRYFCDTSALIKLYHAEIGTDVMDSVFGSRGISVIISELTMIEFYSALAKKLRVGEIFQEARQEGIRNFDKDCRDRFIIRLLDRTVVKTARELIVRHGNRFSIRTLDAIQLSACLSEKSDRFVCSDTNLIKIALSEGIAVLNPEFTATAGKT